MPACRSMLNEPYGPGARLSLAYTRGADALFVRLYRTAA